MEFPEEEERFKPFYINFSGELFRCSVIEFFKVQIVKQLAIFRTTIPFYPYVSKVFYNIADRYPLFPDN